MAPPSEPDNLVSQGERIFLDETFDGNGRTCGTCHRPTDNFALSPEFIARLPADDPLFVAETNSQLGRNFENPRLMRELGLILENQDGFDDLENDFNMRGIPHTLALSTSVASSAGPRTGWSGDGAPGDGSLRAFATGAVIQHFTRTTNRIAGVDFRLPTEGELDALEAFQLSLGRREDLALPLPLRGVVPARGQEIFMDNTLGKCNACHFNAGANADPEVFGAESDNRNFDTGVEDLPDQPADLTGERVPEDDGFGIPGNGEFNTPPLVEAADTGPFFHNNSIETVEGAVAFYNGRAFNSSPAGQLLIAATGSGIDLDATQVVAVAAFLRVINVLDNIRSSNDLIGRAIEEPTGLDRSVELLERAISDTEDAVRGLGAGGLHATAGLLLDDTQRLLQQAVRTRSRYSRAGLGRRAIALQELARAEIILP
jgi:mono/diheme cytochrome c family protein